MAISTTDYIKAQNEPCTCKVCMDARKDLIEALELTVHFLENGKTVMTKTEVVKAARAVIAQVKELS